MEPERAVAAVESILKSRTSRIAERHIATAVASLKVGRHLLVTSSDRAVADGFVEVLVDVATDTGMCLGGITMRGGTTELLTLEEILMPPFRRDFWLIARDTIEPALERLLDYARSGIPSDGWRFLATAELRPRLADAGTGTAVTHIPLD